jgi:tetratricopeptide (TPR) repeat protein
MKIDDEISVIVAAARRRDYEAALARCTQLVESFPSAAEPLRHKAYIHALMNDYESAVKEMSRAIALVTDEPAYYVLRGRYLLMLNQNADATGDLDRVLTLSDELGSEYYKEMAHFLRAESYVRQGKFKEALSDCEHVRDEVRVWVGSLQSKKDIVERCVKELGD